MGSAIFPVKYVFRILSPKYKKLDKLLREYLTELAEACHAKQTVLESYQLWA